MLPGLICLVCLSIIFIEVSSASADELPVPLLSVSLNYDKHDYLLKLLTSIDHPITEIALQVGNANASIVDGILRTIEVYKARNPVQGQRISVHSLQYNPGSAKGFNFGLRRMMMSSSNWVLVSNSDIEFKPGVLGYLSRSVHAALVVDTTFGVGFLNLCCGGEWSALVFTRALVERIGYFDENFYPAYYEDDDYGIRIALSGFKAHRFVKANVTHSGVDGSKKYVSGVESTLIGKKKVLTPEQLAWRRVFREGILFSREYIKNKWDIRLTTSSIQPNCKTFKGINKACKVGVRHPFGDESKGLDHWVLNQTRLDYLVRLGSIA